MTMSDSLVEVEGHMSGQVLDSVEAKSKVSISVVKDPAAKG